MTVTGVQSTQLARDLLSLTSEWDHALQLGVKLLSSWTAADIHVDLCPASTLSHKADQHKHQLHAYGRP